MDQERPKAASSKSNASPSVGSNDAPLSGETRRPSGTVRLARDGQEALAAEQPTNLIVCPVCNLKNPENEPYCADCGFRLGSPLSEAALYAGRDELASFPHLEDGSGRNFPLRPGVNTLGRENTDILLVDRSVSRYHGMIVYDEERGIFSVEDSGSTNGSQVNGEPLPARRPRPIHPGDVLRFGNITVRFVAEGSAQVSKEPATSSETHEPTLPTASGHDQIVQMPSGRLVLLRGSGPREFQLDQGVTTIGRHPDNTICLTDDRYVSGHHCKIEVDGDLFLLLDLGSTNGTFLNGLRLTTNTAIAISAGDEVLIGGLLFQFQKVGDRLPVEPTLERTLLGAPSLDHLSAQAMPLDGEGMARDI